MDATFLHGDPVMVDHTPSSAVSAGDVVVSGDLALVAHNDIDADRMGALASGGGVYKCTADAAIASGKKVYWNAAASKVTETAGANKVFGYVNADSSSAADEDPIEVIHKPEVD